ncbi:MAG: fibronectin type III domain-containing protein [Acidovorax sp.]|nr:fibronectin type III domain-containing protein [Acidovorax sp.]
MTFLGLGAVQPSWAISSGCAAIQAYWSGGITFSGGAQDYRDGYSVTTGEKITYQATSSGSTNASNNQFSGGGFAIYKNDGVNFPADLVVEQYAYDGNELNLNGTYTVLANDANHVVYLWSGSSGATSTATVTCQAVSPPSVTNANISISGATGTGGAYKIGDTVTATWDNTAGGDNNSGVTGVTVNFSQFGGGAAVAATNSSGTWTATYTITAGAVSNTNRNVSVTATNAGGNTTMADSTNATVDNIQPAVSSIAVSGSPAANATSMAFTVNFNELVGNISTDDFALAATGTAAGAIAGVSASSGSSVDVTVSGISGNGTLKLTLNGGTNVQDAAGNASPAAYSSGATHTVLIPTAPTAPTIGTATAGDGQASVTFTAPASNGGSAITTYTATANPGGAFGTCPGPAACTATVTGLNNGTAYTFTVTATNAVGTSVASGASNSATPKGDQAITFANPGAQNFGTTPTLPATASSGLTPTFTSSTTGVCTITSGGALTFVAAGSCSIDADQSGNGAWNAAPTVTRSFAVNAIVPGAPTIGTATAGDTQATVTFTAPASTGGAAILAGGYTVTANPGGFTGTGSSSPITVTGLTNGVAYTFRVTATNSAGEGNPSAASNSVTPASPQTITFNNPGAQNFGTTPTLTATSSAGGGYAVSFTTATAGVCTITAGGALTFVTAGSCTINANQAGDTSFLAAPQVSQTFTVNAIVPGAPTIGTATAGDTEATVTFAAPASTGGAAIIASGYTVTANPGGANATGSNSPVTVTGLTNGVAYTFTVTATNSAGTGAASAASNSITPAAIQTITFNNPGAQNFSSTPTLTATSDSGLTPTFTSSTTGVCTITTGGALTFVSAGTCTINADQAGNGSYLAATQVSRSFTVNAVVPGAPTIVTASAGNAEATVTFTAPASTGGASITGYTVTASPGGATATGAASPITVMGLTNGTSYTFTVAATNSVGPGAPSAASNAVVPRLLTATGTPPGMVGAATATLSGGGPTCTLDPTSGFASLSNPAPAGKTMPYGEYAFQATSCTGTVTMAITYPQALPAGMQFWKFGPATAAVGGVVAASTWFQLGGVTLSGDRKTVTYTVTDNGAGDSDATVGGISDPFALAAGPLGGGAVGIPVDAPWALGLLSAMLGFLGWRRQRGLSRG